MTSRDSCSLDVSKLGKHEPQRRWSVDNVDEEGMPALPCKKAQEAQVELSRA